GFPAALRSIAPTFTALSTALAFATATTTARSSASHAQSDLIPLRRTLLHGAEQCFVLERLGALGRRGHLHGGCGARTCARCGRCGAGHLVNHVSRPAIRNGHRRGSNHHEHGRAPNTDDVVPIPVARFAAQSAFEESN